MPSWNCFGMAFALMIIGILFNSTNVSEKRMKSENSFTNLKLQNIRKVKEALLKLGSASKPEVANYTGLTSATCGTILNNMVETGEAVEDKRPQASSGGRPAKTFHYNADFGIFLCMYALFENGVESICYQVKDILGDVRESNTFEVRHVNLDVLRECAQDVLGRYDAKAIAIGVQGCVNKGIVEFSDFPSLNGVDVAGEISRKLGVPVILENDMNAIALGHSKMSTNEKNVAILFFPKGRPPAGGFLVDGNILRGSTNLSGEFSYFPFPFTKSEQNKFFNDSGAALPIILQIIFATMVFLDPSTIVLTGSLAKDVSESVLKNQLRHHLNRMQLPKIEFKSDLKECYFSGLASVARKFVISA